jgi:hypothetical protein
MGGFCGKVSDRNCLLSLSDRAEEMVDVSHRLSSIDTGPADYLDAG